MANSCCPALQIILAKMATRADFPVSTAVLWGRKPSSATIEAPPFSVEFTCLPRVLRLLQSSGDLEQYGFAVARVVESKPGQVAVQLDRLASTYANAQLLAQSSNDVVLPITSSSPKQSLSSPVTFQPKVSCQLLEMAWQTPLTLCPPSWIPGRQQERPCQWPTWAS